MGVKLVSTHRDLSNQAIAVIHIISTKSRDDQHSDLAGSELHASVRLSTMTVNAR